MRDKRSFMTCFMALCSLVSLFLAPAIAQERLTETKGPTTITASTLTADNKARTALFEGSVVAKNDAITIQSDRMLVHYAEEGKVTRIEATGHVKVIKGERIITSDAATYFADEEKVVFTGQPMAMEGGNVVSGTKMIYLVREDRSIVENSKVFIENRKSR
jgi:lipopolysaccharide export system protein LptA